MTFSVFGAINRIPKLLFMMFFSISIDWFVPVTSHVTFIILFDTLEQEVFGLMFEVFQNLILYSVVLIGLSYYSK